MVTAVTVTVWLRYWQGNGLAIHRSEVRVLTGHHCVVTFGNLDLCASVTKQYNLILAKGVISLAGKVTAGLVESNSSLPLGYFSVIIMMMAIIITSK